MSETLTSKEPFTLEDFTRTILPGILERTKELGHFRNRASHELISPKEMSDHQKEDFVVYSQTVDAIKRALDLLKEEENQRGLVLKLKEIYSNLQRVFGEYRGDGEYGTHYFAEYIKNKASILMGHIEGMEAGIYSVKEVQTEFAQILQELAGSEEEQSDRSALSELSMR